MGSDARTRAWSAIKIVEIDGCGPEARAPRGFYAEFCQPGFSHDYATLIGFSSQPAVFWLCGPLARTPRSFYAEFCRRGLSHGYAALIGYSPHPFVFWLRGPLARTPSTAGRASHTATLP